MPCREHNALQIEALFSRIRTLTALPNVFVSNNNMEQCLPLIVERQTLLEELQDTLGASGLLAGESKTKQLYVALLLETKEDDTLTLQNVIIERDKTKKSIYHQSIANKAISAYKKTSLG